MKNIGFAILDSKGVISYDGLAFVTDVLEDNKVKARLYKFNTRHNATFLDLEKADYTFDLSDDRHLPLYITDMFSATQESFAMEKIFALDTGHA